MLRRNPGGAAELSTGECSARRKGRAEAGPCIPSRPPCTGGRGRRPALPAERRARGGTTGSPTLLQLDGGSRFLELGLQLVGLVLGERLLDGAGGTVDEVLRLLE